MPATNKQMKRKPEQLATIMWDKRESNRNNNRNRNNNKHKIEYLLRAIAVDDTTTHPLRYGFISPLHNVAVNARPTFIQFSIAKHCFLDSIFCFRARILHCDALRKQNKSNCCRWMHQKIRCRDHKTIRTNSARGKWFIDICGNARRKWNQPKKRTILLSHNSLSASAATMTALLIDLVGPLRQNY